MDKSRIEKYIKVIETSLAHIREELAQSLQAEQEASGIHSDRKTHIDSLMGIDCWPEAVNEDFVADDNAEAQAERAHVILDSILDESLEGKSILDYGCGAGYLVEEAINRGARAIGYDIESHERWGGNCVTDISNLKPGSFDIILLYDVLDHCVNVIDPSDIMKSLKRLLKKDGKVYIRCHPWTSKTATHLYKLGINKAYLHLFLKWDEFDYLGVKPIPTRMEKNPLVAYRWWFRDYNILSERIFREPVSPFFFEPSFKQLVIDEQQLEGIEQEDFFKRLDVQYVDYKLTPK